MLLVNLYDQSPIVSTPIDGRNGLLTLPVTDSGMVRSFLPLMALLMACNAPSPHFRGVPATRVTVDGSVFDVRVKGNLAEAIRVNAQYAPRFGPIRSRAAFAMAQVSGCKVTRVDGDQALATGKLSCAGRPDSWTGPIGPSSYSCVQLSQWLRDSGEATWVEFECDPY